MNRVLALVALGGLIVLPGVSDAAPAKKTERTVTAPYTGACQAGIDGANGGINGCPNEMSDAAKKGEAFVTISATDSTGAEIGIVTYDPADYGSTATNYCGSTGKAVKIKAGTEIAVKTILDPTCGGIPTQGTLTMVFSNLK